MTKNLSVEDWTTPSKVLQIALDDLRSVRAQPDVYTVHMNYWHHPMYAVTSCAVCLAGAVMVGSLDVPPSSNISLDAIIDPNIRTALDALDDYRSGDIDKFISNLTSDDTSAMRLTDLYEEKYPYRTYEGRQKNRHLDQLEAQLERDIEFFSSKGF